MADCPRCGAVLAGRATTCPVCRSRIEAPVAKAPRRPLGVSMVAFLLLALAVAYAVGGLAFMAGHVGVGPHVPLAGVVLPEEPDGVHPLAMGQVFAFLALVFTLCVSSVAMGAGLLLRKEWARVGSVVLAAFGVLAGGAQILLGDADGLLGMLAWGGLVVYFLRPEIKAWFRHG